MKHPLCLQAREITGNELADCANMRRQFLIAGGQYDFHACGGTFAFLLRETQQKRGQSVTHRGEREFFDDANQSTQARTDHPQDLQRYLRMGQTQCLKILLTDKEQLGLVDSRHGRGIAPAIEDGEFGNGTAWTINAEYLFASIGRTLKDSHMAGLDDIESRARLTFAEHALPRRIAARQRTLRQKTQFALRQPGKDLDFR